MTALTFLNDSLKHIALPKHTIATGCCAIAMMVGSIRRISSGKEYQLNWSIISLISSNPELNRCPISHEKNSKPNAKNTRISNIIIINGSF